MNELEHPAPLRIEIRGMPHPQPRPRHVAGQGFVSTMGPRVKAWRLKLAYAISDAAVAIGEAEVERYHAGALGIDLWFTIPVPAGKGAWIGQFHHQKPDTDNLAKPVLDELQNAKLLPDDGRIADLRVRKVWGRAQDAGLVLLLTPLPAPKVGRPGESDAWMLGGATPPAWLGR